MVAIDGRKLQAARKVGYARLDSGGNTPLDIAKYVTYVVAIGRRNGL